MASSSSSLPSLFTSLTCSTSLVDTSSQPVLHWLGFIFLSPCPQRALSASIDVLFFLLVLAFLLHKLISKTQINKPHLVKTSFLFYLPVTVTVVFFISYIVLSILAFTKLAQSPWELKEAIYRLIKGITHFSILVFLANQKHFRDVTHHWVVRVYWILNVFMVGVFTASTVMRMTSVEQTQELELRIDDIVTLVSIPLSLVLLIISINGSVGITITAEKDESRVKEPLLRNGQSSEASDGGAVGPGYGSASFLSKLFWIWLNPLLAKGYKSPLKIEDIPPLAPEHSAEETSKIFEANFPTPDEKSEHPVRVALFRCFWKELVFTGFLAIIRLSVMYMGPVLLQGFVNFASGNGSSPYEGLYLCALLLSAKFVEVLSAHQFNFQSQRVGMLIRSSLITSLYKKGLRLSSSSRQAHGIGQIVNYMAVDAQQLSDMVMQLHNVWLMPCQVLVALTLLYRYLGLSALGALLTVVLIMLVVALNTVRNNGFQMRIMMLKDSRMKATTEMLNNMRVIKFQAWEEHFNNKIQQSRDDEYHWLSKFVFGMTTNIVLLFNTPVIVATVSFGAAIFLGIPLNAATVFSSTSIFRILQEPINSFPQALMSFSQAMISLGRLDKYLKSKELAEGSVERVEGCSGDIAIEVSDGVFGWDDESGDVCLKNLNLSIKKGELAAIVGTVGSGKSSLLASILGEMHKISGKVRVCGSTAYVAQTSWIQNGTIQDNILFNSPMDIHRYREVIRLCSLDKDLEMMEFGDQTEIGERGINLSGGQKQRIQLARAVYQDCDIYLLDDVFSAVDAHTGSDLFKDCIRGALKNKTILLVTHQVDFLHNADHIFVMRDGMIVQSGKYDDLNESGLDFRALVAAHETSMELVDVNDDEANPSPKSPKLEKPASPHPQLANGGDSPLTKSKSKKATAKIIEDEERESGTVSLNVYKEYSTEAFGWCGVLLVLVMTLVWQGFLMAGDYWLAYETNEVRAVSFNPFLFIQVYAIIALFSCVMALVRNLFVSYVGLRTSQIFFNKLLHSISHAPMSFFDTTPSGRVLSRASTDQINLDLLLPFFMGITVTSVMSVLSIIVVTCQVAWPTIFLVIPLVWCNFWYRGYFLTSSRELTRLDSITKAPVIHHFSESVTGVTTIRSFQKVDQFCQENIKRANANLSMYFHNNGTNEWLGFRLEMIGSLFLCLSALFMVLLPSNIIKPELVGLSLSYGLSLNSVIYFALYISCSVENRMISVERLKQFINIPSEAPWRIKDCVPSPDWPTHGDVDIQNLQVRYRPNTPLILKGLTLFIRGGEKVGVVGRTGSGKSTLIQALFRVMEPSGGNITIDGVDITKLGLHDLRTRFGIIPQEPVLFRGTVRSNIDPIGQYSDEEIWKSLERCQLSDVVSAKPDKLDASVADSGDNWSVGQRQLLCLGRVMLKRSRILFMDEATASVDSQTDGAIQRIIREEFAACTIISIAHRIPTVMDCDKVLVVDQGRAAELDKPSRLIEQHSLFAALVQEYASRSAGL